MKQIFVFGSNLAGIHGAGSAQAARLYHGAEIGVGVGPTGRAYAIPTKDRNFDVLSIEEIKTHVDTFIQYADDNPDMLFRVVAIGTGLAGFTHAQMAPLFKNAPANCILPKEWEQLARENV